MTKSTLTLLLFTDLTTKQGTVKWLSAHVLFDSDISSILCFRPIQHTQKVSHCKKYPRLVKNPVGQKRQHLHVSSMHITQKNNKAWKFFFFLCGLLTIIISKNYCNLRPKHCYFCHLYMYVFMGQTHQKPLQLLTAFSITASFSFVKINKFEQ